MNCSYLKYHLYTWCLDYVERYVGLCSIRYGLKCDWNNLNQKKKFFFFCKRRWKIKSILAVERHENNMSKSKVWEEKKPSICSAGLLKSKIYVLNAVKRSDITTIDEKKKRVTRRKKNTRKITQQNQSVRVKTMQTSWQQWYLMVLFGSLMFGCIFRWAIQRELYG